ncbi:hypothetical protein BJV78DRAFT_223346 [Lactifluus subvellereus]|nr:hypothetical protein BJV78DRAFT_223346 [Lactifluus subvellereus]
MMCFSTYSISTNWTFWINIMRMAGPTSIGAANVGGTSWCRFANANMLAHSPRLPLTINYYNTPREDSDASEGILLALRHSDRVHYICLDLLRLVAPLRVAELRVAKLREIITTMDGQFPILERLYILSSDEDVVLPRTFQAPHLRHLYLWGAALPIGSPLLTTTVGLVTLILRDIPLSAYFPPNYLLTRLSLMPQLEIVQISFRWPRQLLDTPIVTHITLPNLRRFVFGGVSAYLEGLLAQIIAPVLSELYIELFYQLPFTVSHFSRLMGTSKILIFSVVMLTFSHNYVSLRSFQPGKKDNPPFRMTIKYIHDRQVTVASAVQVLTTLQPVLSIVEQLILSSQSSEWDNEVDRTLWRQLLRPFSNLKTLHVQYSLVGKLACSLQTDDGEPPLELLPNLKEVGYSGDYARDVFTPFINEREVAGHPVNLTMVDHSVFWWS